YVAQLRRDGIEVAERGLTEATSLAQLRAYNLVVIPDFVTLDEAFSVGAVDVPTWWDVNLPELRRYVEAGGGLLLATHFRESGEGLATALNRMLQPWGAMVRAQQIIDPGHIAQFDTAAVACAEKPGRTVTDGSFYCWTERVTPHPATAGVRRIYYPVVNMRWDDCYTTPPFVLVDPAWTPLVRAMAGSGAYATKTDKLYRWQDPLGRDDTIAAVRAVGRGRVALLGIDSYFTFFRPYTGEPGLGENHHGAIDGIFLQKGDGRTPSDGQQLLRGLFRWLAEPGVAAGLGGPLPPSPPVPAPAASSLTRVIDWNAATMPPTWRHRPIPVRLEGTTYYDEQPDITITGPLRHYRALIGARSAYSDGAGTVAEYAAAAREAGYSVLAFTERFEELGGADAWQALVTDCLQASTDSLVCLPGIDIGDPEGGRYLIFGQPNYPAVSWLTPDGRYLAATNAMSLGFTTHMAVIARPQHSPIEYRLFKHFQGMAVATYRGGAQVDDGLEAYTWEVASGSNPIPVAVHEVTAPDQVAAASRTGLQQVLPSDSVPHAADYFRCALAHFFDTPPRYYLSEGPVVETLAIRNKDEGDPREQRHRWRLAVGARADVALVEVLLYQDGLPSRRWQPRANAFAEQLDGYHAWQHHWFATARDVDGRRAIGPALRTVPRRYVVRCGDRQNWLGEVAFQYTGMGLRDIDLHLPVEDLPEGDATWRYDAPPGAYLAPMLEFPFASNRVCNTDFILGQRFPGVTRFEDFAFDAAPMHATAPARLYDGRVRVLHYTPRAEAPEALSALLYEVDLRLKTEARPRGADSVWPWFARPEGSYRVRAAAGWQTGQIDSAAAVDLQPGDVAGEFVILSPGLRLAGGRLGLAAPDALLVPAGTRFRARFLHLNRMFGETQYRQVQPFDVAGHLPELAAAMGFDGPTPFGLVLTQGRLDHLAYEAFLAADG
ncbi:MAG: hypothetical protein ABIL09_27680, partial [Gemmatimonadota bacterium]